MIRSSTIVVAFVLSTLTPVAIAGDSILRVYATWNPADAHELLEFTSDNLTVLNGRNFWAGARATVSVDTGIWYWETTYSYFPIGYSDVQTGIAYSDWDLEAAPGSAGIGARSVGTNRNGDIFVGGQLLSTINPIADSSVVRHLLDADSGEYQVANGSGPWVSATLSPGFFAGTPQFPIASIAGGSGAAVVIANFGASAFAFAVPAGANPGIYFEIDFDDLILQDGFDGPP